MFNKVMGRTFLSMSVFEVSVKKRYINFKKIKEIFVIRLDIIFTVEIWLKGECSADTFFSYEFFLCQLSLMLFKNTIIEAITMELVCKLPLATSYNPHYHQAYTDK